MHTHIPINSKKLEICLWNLETILEPSSSLFSLSLVCGPAKVSLEAEVCPSEGRGRTAVCISLVTAAGGCFLQS